MTGLAVLFLVRRSDVSGYISCHLNYNRKDGGGFTGQSRLQTKSESETDRNSFVQNERTETLTADVGTVFHHLELNFILATGCAFTLLFQGHHAALLLPWPEEKNLNPLAPNVWILSGNGYGGETARQNRLEISSFVFEEQGRVFSSLHTHRLILSR